MNRCRMASALTYCLPAGPSGPPGGFYLLRTVGSDQGGMSGFKGGIIRRKGVDRALTILEKTLESNKQALESHH